MNGLPENTRIAKPYTCSELASLYGVSRKTLRTWLLPHLEVVGERQAKYFTTKQVKAIYMVLGLPWEEVEER